MSEHSDPNQSLVVAETDGETARKLFVGGLSWQTTEDGLQRYLESLSLEVERVLIMRDKLTGRSRGFGFVILKQQDMLDKAVNGTLQLDGRKIEAKRAIPKRDMEKSGRKVFVGGIPISLTAADFRKFFEQFGPVTDAQVMTERESGRSRGFGFVTFGDDETLEKVLAQQHSIQGKPVEVKRAEPKKVERQQRPIILPVPAYFSPTAYPYQVAYPSSNSAGAAAIYGQALTYDPASGQYYLASPMYTPQFISVEDANAAGYDQQYYYDSNGSASNPASPPSSTPISPEPASSSSTSKRARREVVSVPKGEWTTEVAPGSPPSATTTLVERVRLQNEVRKKRGMSNPEPDRTVRKLSTTPLPQTSNVGSQRKSVVSMATAGNWRSRVNASASSPAATTSATNSNNSSANTTKEGGSLHKYFQ